MTKLFERDKQGHILIFTLAVLAVLFVLTTAALDLIRFDQKFANQSYRVKQARQIAEGGVDWAIRSLNNNSNYSGEANVSLGEGVFTTIVSGTGSSRTIESYGYVPNAATPQAKRKIIVNASLDSDTVEFFYGVQVGQGGLSLTNSSGIIGNVYSNGNIVGANSSYITGDAVVAGGLSDNPQLEWPTQNQDQAFATTSSNRDIAQSFTATSTGQIPKVRVFLGKNGSPTNNLTVRINADSSGKPSTSSLASTVIPAATVGTIPSWIDATFNSAPTVNNGTKYWVVLDYNTNSATNYWNWRKDSSNAYANNTGRTTASYSSGSATWVDVGGDLAFQVWIGGSATRIYGMTIGSASSGTAQANQFVNTSVHGSSCPNQYCVVSNPAQQPLPISDGVIADWKNDAAAGGTYAGNYNLSGFQTANLGPVKIAGNMTISNSARMTVTGTVWVTGNIYLSNTSVTQLDPGYGANSGVIIADGTITVSNSVVIQGSGTAGSYIMLLSDRNATTQTSISVSNGSTAVIYYAGKSWIQFSNTARAKEATAYGITMSNSSTITYESGLANSSFTSGPGGGWIVKRSTWREIRNF